MPPKFGVAAPQKSFNVGDWCFFNPPGTNWSWIVGKVQAIKDGDAKVRKRATVKAEDDVRHCTETFEALDLDKDLENCREDLLSESVNDLLSLTMLQEASLLRTLALRYSEDKVYTNIGAIVVALNPFNFKIPWYTDDNMPNYLKFQGQIISATDESTPVLPHSWAQAHNTFTEMRNDGENQCILISGESGAGKTEATKIVMKYLAQISCITGTDQERTEALAVGSRLNMCSPILESFGNARTVRNDNSSRFGKFMKVRFNRGGFLVGAHTTKYLLEKSRIVTASKNERVYHSFYIAARGSYAKDFDMEADVAYKNLTAGQCMQNSEFNSAEDFKGVKEAMLGIGMEESEIRSVWAATCGIMSVLNLGFLADGEGSKIDDKTSKYLDRAVALWKVDKAALVKEFNTTTLVIMNKPTVKLLSPVYAIDIRDATAKALYNALFGTLVEKCNEKCDIEGVEGNWIGLLDIFGFEDFEKNSFEQLCINLANETLQNHYNTYIFKKDMEECRAEGIDVTEVKCPDNMPCLEMIRGKGGIMLLLDEECMLGQGSDLGFLAKVEGAFGKHEFWDKKKSSKDTFMIKHYAATVTYSVDGWLEKNRDTLKDDIKKCMRASEDVVVKELLDEPLPPDQKKGRVTVGGFFKEQVQMLMDVINSTNPHWIRCVKPHPAKKPKMFDGVQTMNQLESSGVLGTVKIRKAGYPIRVVFAKFTIRYKIIAQSSKKEGRDLCTDILKAAQMSGKEHAQIGKTKVFMKSEAFPLIERRRNEALAKYVLDLQRFGQGLLGRVATNKEWRDQTQKKAATLFVTEYRLYLKRSAEIREERARIRKEIEERFRGQKVQLERDFNNFFDQQVSQYETDLDAFKVKLEKELEAERRRQEQWKGAREAFFRTEYVARMHLFDECLTEAMTMQDLYDQELQLFRELELACVEESAKALRIQIMNDEREARNVLWRGLQKMQAASQLDAYLVVTLQGLGFVREAEDLSWSELHHRMRLLKQELKIRMTFRGEEQLDLVKSKQREKAHKIFDKQKDRELLQLRSKYNEELSRLEEQRRSALMTLEASSPAELHAMGSGIPAGGGSTPGTSRGVGGSSKIGGTTTTTTAAAAGGVAAGASPAAAGGGGGAGSDAAAVAAIFGTPNASPSRGSALGASPTGAGAAGASSLDNYSPSLVRAVREAYGNDGHDGAARAIDTLSQQRSRLLPNEHAHWYDIDSKLSTASERQLQSALSARQHQQQQNQQRNYGAAYGGGGGADNGASPGRSVSGRTNSAGPSIRSGSHMVPTAGAGSPARGGSATLLGTLTDNGTGGSSPSTMRGAPLAHYAGSMQLSGSTADNFLFGAPPPRHAQPPIIQRGAPQPAPFQTASPLGRLTAATADNNVFGSPMGRTRRY